MWCCSASVGRTCDGRANIIACVLTVVALTVPLSDAAVKAPPFNSHWYVGNEEYDFKQTSDYVKWEPTHPQVNIYTSGTSFHRFQAVQ